MRSYNFYVYIMANRPQGVLYIGVTNNLERRVIEHRQLQTKGFTSRYHCHRLVYCEHHPDVYEAIGREKQLKGLLRIKKIALVETTNPRWHDLSRDWF